MDTPLVMTAPSDGCLLMIADGMVADCSGFPRDIIRRQRTLPAPQVRPPLLDFNEFQRVQAMQCGAAMFSDSNSTVFILGAGARRHYGLCAPRIVRISLTPFAAGRFV
jgi:hypothetical protein